MSWKSKITSLSWQFKLMIAFGIIGFAAAAFLKLPASRAQSDSERAVQEAPVGVKNGRITEYPNGVKSIEPSAFAVTDAVRDMPAAPPGTDVNSKLKREARRIERMREKGMSVDEIQKEEINRQNAKRIKKEIPGEGAGAGDGKFQDPLVNNGSAKNAPQVMPTPGLTFNGASQTDNAAVGIGGVLPPDVNGDVGLNHYVSSVNLVVKFYNKNGTVAAGPIATNALFNALPANDPCRAINDGDPIVLYDTLADRWHISQFALPGSPNNFQCVALSVTGDPTGAYYVWSYEYPDAAFNDYPKVGVWTDAYHMTFNQFNSAGTAFIGAGFLSQDRPRALRGDPNAGVVYFNLNNIEPTSGGLLPGDIDGYVPPPAGLPEVIGEYRADEFGDPADGLRNYIWIPNFNNPGMTPPPTFTEINLAPFDARNPGGRLDVEQMGGANLDSIADRSMHRFAYRNFGTFAAPVNSYVGNFTVNVSGVAPTNAGTYQAGVRWFELRRSGNTFSVFDQGTHNLAPGNGASGLNNWMSSIAQDNDGNIGLGFSQSGTTQRADIKIAGRTGGLTPAGTLNEGEALFHAATGSQTSTSGRWGDYSAMNVDPVDGCTFWYTQEYYAATSAAGWSTRVGRFIYPSCTPEPTATITGTITSCSTGNPVDQASVDATGGFNRLTVANGTYSMIVAPGTYTVSASKQPGFAGSGSVMVTVAAGQTATANICLNGVAVLSAGPATITAESCLPANGAIDPGETVTVSFGVQNNGGANTVNAVGTLQNTGGVTSASGPQNYGVITSGGPVVSRSFTFTADPTLLCGSNITASLQVQDGASNLGTLTYTLPTGSTGGGATTTSYTGPPVAIPDNNPAGANAVLNVSGFTGAVADLDFRLDALAGCDAAIGNTNASVDHTFNGDLIFRLTSPMGTTVTLIGNRGSNGRNFCTVTINDEAAAGASSIPGTGAVTGSFRPESPLSAFDGQNPNGNWTLNVADVAGVDVGSIRRFSLLIAARTCCTGGPTPVISGRVFYANTPAPTPLPIPFTTISAAGSIPRSTVTDANGNYTLSGFGSGAYTVTPSKTGQVNGISNLDASRIAQHIVGLTTLNPTQLIAADTSNNGTVGSLDAAFTAQFISGISNPGITGTWKFQPANRSYATVTGNQMNQDYSGILVGEVTGNWNPAGPLLPELSSAGSRPTREDSKTAGGGFRASAEANQSVEKVRALTVDLTAADVTGKGIIAYQFDLLYDSKLIEADAQACEVSGTISEQMTAVCRISKPGVLKVVVFGTKPLMGEGTLLKLNFKAVGRTARKSALSLQNFIFNEGVPGDVTVNGRW